MSEFESPFISDNSLENDDWSDAQRLESFREELDTFNNSELWAAWDRYWALEDEGIHQEMPAEAMQAAMVWVLAVFDEMCRRGF